MVMKITFDSRLEFVETHCCYFPLHWITEYLAYVSSLTFCCVLLDFWLILPKNERIVEEMWEEREYWLQITSLRVSSLYFTSSYLFWSKNRPWLQSFQSTRSSCCLLAYWCVVSPFSGLRSTLAPLFWSLKPLVWHHLPTRISSHETSTLCNFLLLMLIATKLES